MKQVIRSEDADVANKNIDNRQEMSICTINLETARAQSISEALFCGSRFWESTKFFFGIRNFEPQADLFEYQHS